MANSFSHAAWDGSASRFSIEEWKRSTLIDTGEGDPNTKDRYKLPVREPSGAVNINALHAAASALAGGRGGVQASAEAKKSALRKLRTLYREAKLPMPPMLSRGGM